jgi:hypothetical protein
MADSMLELVLRGTFNIILLLMRNRKESQSVFLLYILVGGVRGMACVPSVIRIGVWSEDRSRQDVASANEG